MLVLSRKFKSEETCENKYALHFPWDEKLLIFQCEICRYPLIDANMKELAATGFMSNRGRQVHVHFIYNVLQNFRASC